MRKIAVPVCLMLLLALLPAAALGEAAAAMTPCSLEGIPFRVWSDWEPQETGDDSLVFYGTHADPAFDGYLLLAAEDSANMTDMTAEMILRNFAEGIGAEMDEGMTAEMTRVCGREGLFLSGTLYGMFRVEGYLCLSESRAVAALLVGNADNDAAVLRDMLLTVLGEQDTQESTESELSAEVGDEDTYEILGLVCHIPAGWQKTPGEGGTVYWMKTGTPADGLVMVTAGSLADYEGEINAQTLASAMDELAGALDEEPELTNTDLGGRTGVFFSGSLFGYAKMAGYSCLAGDSLVTVAVADAVSEPEELQAMLMTVLGE